MLIEKEEFKKLICDFIDKAETHNITYNISEFTIPCVTEHGCTLYKLSGRKELYLRILIDTMEKI